MRELHVQQLRVSDGRLPRVSPAEAPHDFPFDASANLEALLSHALKSLQREWVACASAALLYVLVVDVGSILISWASEVAMMGLVQLDVGADWAPLRNESMTIILQLSLLPVQCLGSLGLTRMMLDVAMGRSPSAGRFFSQMRLMPRALAIQLPFWLVMASPSLANGARHTGSLGELFWFAFLPLFSVFGLSWWLFSIPELVISDCSAFDAMARGFSLGGGAFQRGRVFGYAVLAGLLALAGVLACSVGVLGGLPFGSLLVLTLYLALRKSSSLPAPAAL